MCKLCIEGRPRAHFDSRRGRHWHTTTTVLRTPAATTAAATSSAAVQ